MMKIRLLAFLIFLPAASFAAAAGPNWVARVAISAVGGHVMGNPAAKTRVIEYVSYTCSHCAHFVGEASAPLKANYVRGGKVSVEVRHAVRDKYDMAAALLARCGGPRRFFGNHEMLFANQSVWMKQVIAYDGDAAAKPTDQKAALRDIGQKTGLYALMTKRGFARRQLDACINDPVATKALVAMTDEAWNKVKIQGTPGFTVNGTLVGGSDWAALQAALPPAAQ
ncbi:thioredoxin domain-containing protein [Sphingobium sp. AN558]|uniref:thioredoxin domain-containing protein n=1 Tax=Sphingobium sp. AN558 TaxID=3133442 RepID=UPI0030C5EDB2